MKWLKAGLAGLFIIPIGYLLFWPVPVDPVAWSPPDNPGFDGPYEANTALASATTLTVPSSGPEDVIFDERGRLITGVEDGRIIRRSVTADTVETLASTGGRPLGLDRGPEGNLYVADALRGLFKIDRDRQVSRIHGPVDTRTLGFPNDVAVAEDGTVYFTDSSLKFGYEEIKRAVITHRTDGRLLRYDPETGSTDVMVGHLAFPNGVTLSEDDKTLYLSEMGNYRILTVDTTGQNAGATSVFVDSLPGFPDNISRDDSDRLWVGIATPRNRLLDALGPYPFLRKTILRLPAFLRPSATRHGMVLGFSSGGELLANFQDADGTVAFTASAVHHDNTLYIGSYREPNIRRLKSPPLKK